MRKYIGLIGICILTSFINSCQAEVIKYQQGDIRISIEQGKEWLHNFPLFLGIKIKNAPQIAVWIEDMEGNYVSTVYVTRRIATQNWRMAKGNNRKEALPHWTYRKGNEPLTDGETGASPRNSFDIKFTPEDNLKQFVVKIEVNHSTDFNDYYPRTALPGEKNYSGGKEGSGQPALIYVAEINPESSQKEYEARLLGHSSPDGTDGNIYPDLSGFTTALNIVERITISLQKSPD